MRKLPDPKPNTTRRVRLKGFNYETLGYYFITVCQRDRSHLFAKITNDGLRLSSAGVMVQEVTRDIETRFSHVEVDASVVMPNHVHLLLGMNLAEGDYARDSAIDVMHWWKTQTANRYGWGVKSHGWVRYDKSLWQEGYHDRIVRDQRELEQIRYYIEQNPIRWQDDTYFDEP